MPQGISAVRLTNGLYLLHDSNYGVFVSLCPHTPWTTCNL